MVFIIDEIGMLHNDTIYSINSLLKDLHNTSSRFGGRVLFFFTGDERQLMPIVRGVDPLGQAQAEASFFFSGDRAHCTDHTSAAVGLRGGLDHRRQSLGHHPSRPLR
jgi:hypothetical protein